jgi:hypothetical protein
MSLTSWYLQKATQSGLLAKAAADPGKRADHIETQRLWRQLAIEEEELAIGADVRTSN